MLSMKTLMMGMIVVLLAAGPTGAATVDGVFGLNRVSDSTYLAVWVPLADGAVVTGVSWYQNDDSTVFPEIRAQAGELSWPPAATQAVTLARDVPGTASAWSEWIFDQPVTSVSGGLYLFFRLPPGSVYLHEGSGGGFGMGYTTGDGVRRCWLSGRSDPGERVAGCRGASCRLGRHRRRRCACGQRGVPGAPGGRRHRHDPTCDHGEVADSCMQVVPRRTI